jgi:hypothetical protein
MLIIVRLEFQACFLTRLPPPSRSFGDNATLAMFFLQELLLRSFVRNGKGSLLNAKGEGLTGGGGGQQLTFISSTAGIQLRKWLT